MQQDDESETRIQAEQRRCSARYDRLHKCRRRNSLLAQLRNLAWFAWGAFIALSVDMLVRDGGAQWIIWPFAAVLVYTILVGSVLRPDSEEEVAWWLRTVRLYGFDTRGDIEDVLIPYIEAERLVEEGWLRRAGEGFYEPLDCDWTVLLFGHAHGWKRVHEYH